MTAPAMRPTCWSIAGLSLTTKLMPPSPPGSSTGHAGWLYEESMVPRRVLTGVVSTGLGFLWMMALAVVA